MSKVATYPLREPASFRSAGTKKDVGEDFAESFAAFMSEPAALASADPLMYDLLRTITEDEGLK